MKTKLFISALILSFVVVSCKKEEKAAEGETAAPAANVKEKFSVDLNVVSPTEDNFAVYYTEDNTINFTGEKAAWRGVKAQPGSQLVTVELPEEVIPTNIRIDFGISKERGDVTLENFKLSYYGKSFEAKGSDFLKYFFPNDSITTQVDQAKGTITFLKPKNPANLAFYYPQPAILQEIGKITK